MKPMTDEEIQGAMQAAVSYDDSAQGECGPTPKAMLRLYLIRALSFIAYLQAQVETGYRAPAPPLEDTEKLRAAICNEPEYDQHENLAGAALAVIERFKIERERALATLAAHAEESLVDAAARTRIERDDALTRKLEQKPPPDAVPVLFYRDVGARSSVVGFNPFRDPFRRGEVVTIGEWRYRVIDQSLLKGVGELHVEPLGGAPVVPTGEGLMIARVSYDCAETPLPRDWTALMSRLAQALCGEPEADVDDRHTVDDAIATIERFRDERARHEQRRFDLAEKLGLLIPERAGWDFIADECALRGLLSAPVLRFALAMQERLSANEHKGGWGSDDWFALLKRLREETEELNRVLLEVPTGLSAAKLRGRALRIRREAADVGNFAMMLADNEGDLDTFDAAAEIEAARKSGAPSVDDFKAQADAQVEHLLEATREKERSRMGRTPAERLQRTALMSIAEEVERRARVARERNDEHDAERFDKLHQAYALIMDVCGRPVVDWGAPVAEAFAPAIGTPLGADAADPNDIPF